MLDAPTAREVEEKFSDVIAERCSRDEADRWAAQWVTAEHTPMHPAIWKALMKLHGCDLTHGPGQDYLHSTQQIAEWLEEFRQQYAKS